MSSFQFLLCSLFHISPALSLSLSLSPPRTFVLFHVVTLDHPSECEPCARCVWRRIRCVHGVRVLWNHKQHKLTSHTSFSMGVIKQTNRDDCCKKWHRKTLAIQLEPIIPFHRLSWFNVSFRKAFIMMVSSKIGEFGIRTRCVDWGECHERD